MELFNPKDISLNEKVDVAIKNGFCKSWPVASVALNQLADLVKNPLVRVVTKAVVSVGNAVVKKVCG